MNHVKYFLVCAFLAAWSAAAFAQTVVVGSKKFTESYVLGEIAKRTLSDAGFEVEHKRGMGGTIILWQALKSGAIGLYPEYTGTISEEILKNQGPAMSDDEIRQALRPLGIGMTAQLGFNNTYALVMKRQRAEELGIRKISDLRDHPEVSAALTHEFMGRKDGWSPLVQAYGLRLSKAVGMAHPLGYKALDSGAADVKDAYSTDADIVDRDLAVLEDDRKFFPSYRAVFLYRLDVPEKAIEALGALAGTIDEALMVRLNSEAGKTEDYSKAASTYFELKGAQESKPEPSAASDILRWTGQHLILVAVSLGLAILVALPLGIWASGSRAIGSIVLGLTGMIQTIPSLALLALMVPLIGIGTLPAIVALFLYSLLPIVRNTVAGLHDIPGPLKESAAALGLEPGQRLRLIFLPMASRTILAGVKTSAIINVGTATIAALIGAGGLGEPIISGLDLNSNRLILMGAVPAAILALLIQFLFDGLDRLLIPKGLRLGGTKS